jgi:hypothetical protein
MHMLLLNNNVMLVSAVSTPAEVTAVYTQVTLTSITMETPVMLLMSVPILFCKEQFRIQFLKVSLLVAEKSRFNCKHPDSTIRGVPIE